MDLFQERSRCKLTVWRVSCYLCASGGWSAGASPLGPDRHGPAHHRRLRLRHRGTPTRSAKKRSRYGISGVGMSHMQAAWCTSLNTSFCGIDVSPLVLPLVHRRLLLLRRPPRPSYPAPPPPPAPVQVHTTVRLCGIHSRTSQPTSIPHLLLPPSSIHCSPLSFPLLLSRLGLGQLLRAYNADHPPDQRPYPPPPGT